MKKKLLCLSATMLFLVGCAGGGNTSTSETSSTSKESESSVITSSEVPSSSAETISTQSETPSTSSSSKSSVEPTDNFDINVGSGLDFSKGSGELTVLDGRGKEYGMSFDKAKNADGFIVELEENGFFKNEDIFNSVKGIIIEFEGKLFWEGATIKTDYSEPEELVSGKEITLKKKRYMNYINLIAGEGGAKITSIKLTINGSAKNPFDGANCTWDEENEVLTIGHGDNYLNNACYYTIPDAKYYDDWSLDFVLHRIEGERFEKGSCIGAQLCDDSFVDNWFGIYSDGEFKIFNRNFKATEAELEIINRETGVEHGSWDYGSGYSGEEVTFVVTDEVGLSMHIEAHFIYNEAQPSKSYTTYAADVTLEGKETIHFAANEEVGTHLMLHKGYRGTDFSMADRCYKGEYDPMFTYMSQTINSIAFSAEKAGAVVTDISYAKIAPLPVE